MPRFSNRVFKKRHNEWKKKSFVISKGDVAQTASPTTPNVRDRTSSTKKLCDSNEKFENYESDSNDVNEIINISLLSNILKHNVLCQVCKERGLELKIASHIGLACKMLLKCNKCAAEVSFSNSNSIPRSGNSGKKVYDINVRLVYGLRCIGKGSAAGTMLCGIMNLPKPPTKFGFYNELVGSAAEDIAQATMKKAVEEAVTDNGNCRDLTVALDGSWQRRGHKSLNGVVTATSGDSSKVIDVAILSKHCRCKGNTKDEHSESCKANFHGTSGAMEVEGVKAIFSRSQEWYNVRYTNYLGDGDSKGYKAVEELKPYGNEIHIKKQECIGHVQKRMGARLRKLKQTLGAQKLSDGKTLGGRGRLTDEAIDRLQRYYGCAIRQNTRSIEHMRRAVWALFFHTASTNEHPQHALCPTGDDSWCKYQSGKEYAHKNSLPNAVIDVIKPIFRDLSQPSLLEKCLHGKTQNPNESVNNLIWIRIPKRVFVQIKTLHFGVYDAVATYNEGNIIKCDVLKRLGFQPGHNTISTMRLIDEERLRGAERRDKSLQHAAKGKKRPVKRKLTLEKEEDADNPSYGAGMY